MSKQDEKDKKEREKLDREARRAIGAMLRNPDGITRLRAISDEEWAAAVARDAASETGGNA
jgi:hypothetical protein